MSLDELLSNSQFREQIWSNLENQIKQRCPYLRISDLIRTEIEFDIVSTKWKIEDYGFLVLPMNQLNLNPDFEKLDGGILAFQVSNRDGLEVFGQRSSIIRVPTVKRLQSPLFHFITSGIEKLPALYSPKIIPLNLKKSIGVINILSYENLVTYL